MSGAFDPNLPPLDRLQNLLDHVRHVCPLPATTQRVLSLCSQENVELALVAEAIAADPAMASSVLSYANSAALGVTRQVGELGQAIVLVGLERIRTMAAAFAMLARFHGKGELSLGLHDRALVMGTFARQIAKAVRNKLPVEPEQAYVAGLLSEIGAMACASVDGPFYEQLFHDSHEAVWERLRSEELRYGSDSRHIGQLLLERNDLPVSISQAVGTVGPEMPPGASALDCVVAYAWEVVSSPDVRADLESLETSAARYGLPVDADTLRELTQVVVEKTRRVLHRVR